MREQGLNIRQPLDAFFRKYRVCIDSAVLNEVVGNKRVKTRTIIERAPELYEALLGETVAFDKNSWKVGKTTVFLKTEYITQTLDRLLEKRRPELAKTIQSFHRMRPQRRAFLRTRRAAEITAHRRKAKQIREAYLVVLKAERRIERFVQIRRAKHHARKLAQGQGKVDDQLSRRAREVLHDWIARQQLLGESEQRPDEAHVETRSKSNQDKFTNDDVLTALGKPDAAAWAALLVTYAPMDKKYYKASAKTAADPPSVDTSALVETRLRWLLWMTYFHRPHKRADASEEEQTPPNADGRYATMPRFDTAFNFEGWVRARLIDGRAHPEDKIAYAVLQMGTLLLLERKPETSRLSSAQLGTADAELWTESSKPYGSYVLGLWDVLDPDGRETIVLEECSPLLRHEHTAQSKPTPADQAAIGWWDWLGLGRVTTSRAPPSDRPTVYPEEESYRLSRRSDRGTAYADEEPLRLELSLTSPPSPTAGSRLPSVPRLGDPPSLRSSLNKAMKFFKEVDPFVIRPNDTIVAAAADEFEDEAEALSGASTKSGWSLIESLDDGLPHRHSEVMSADASEASTHDQFVALEGPLLRCYPGDAQPRWARRYFVLTVDGQLLWFASADEARNLSVHSVRYLKPPPGRLALRFFAVHRHPHPDAASAATPGGDAAVGRAESSKRSVDSVSRASFRAESSKRSTDSVEGDADDELAPMLKSCDTIELRSGRVVLQLASHGLVADTWLSALRKYALLGYFKSPAVLPTLGQSLTLGKSLAVEWMDGEYREVPLNATHSVADLVSILCARRFRLNGAALQECAREWGLFELQRHTSTGELPLHKLGSHENVQDQVG